MGRITAVRSPKKETGSSTINIVWADVKGKDLKDLRKKVVEVMAKPKQGLVSNYELHWDQVRVDPKSNKRIVWADISKAKMGDLTKQVEKALADPSYVIVTGYPIYWTELE